MLQTKQHTYIRLYETHFRAVKNANGHCQTLQ